MCPYHMLDPNVRICHPSTPKKVHQKNLLIEEREVYWTYYNEGEYHTDSLNGVSKWETRVFLGLKVNNQTRNST